MPHNVFATAAVLVLAPAAALAAVQTSRASPPAAGPPVAAQPPARAPDHRTSGAPPPAAAEHRSGWGWPLAPRPPVARRFLLGPHRWSPGHRGVDLATRPGAAVVAPAAGVVTFTRVVAGRPVVVITHAGGVRTAYEPARARLPPGAPVARGTVIGTVTAAPGHCRPRTCLHWSARRGDRYIDPLSLLRTPRIALLPMDGAATDPSTPRR